jgi:menaquinone-dependent protoporphyrinogen oxidase
MVNPDLVHEFWRMQLLDELRRKQVSLDYEPQLDPEGRRRAALVELIGLFEDAESGALQERRRDEAPSSEHGNAVETGDVRRSSVVVAHASKRGSTAEVAEAVAERLRERGLRVDVRRAADVRDLEAYAAAVLGGSLYFGRWHGDALQFLKRHQRALTTRPVAIFALGPKTADEHDFAESRAQLDRALRAVPEVDPAAVAIFGGVIDPTKLRFPLSRMEASDARDWDAIAAWADEVASVFAGGAVSV